MISKDKIKKTLVCYWSAEDEAYVAESAMLPAVVIGVGDTKDEAVRTFETTLEGMYDELTNDNVAGYTMGRPSKGYVPFNANIRPSSKTKLAELAEEFDIAQGEVVDFLVFYRDCKLQEQDHVPDKNEILAGLDKINTKLEQFCEQKSPVLDVRLSATRLESLQSLFNMFQEPVVYVGHASHTDAISNFSDASTGGFYRPDAAPASINVVSTRTNKQEPVAIPA